MMFTNRFLFIRRSRFHLKVLVIATIMFAGMPLFAQLAGKGLIKGTVTDSTGAVIANATVTATSDSRGLRSAVTSSSTGDFQISPLDPDVYTVTVTAAGFQTVTQKDVHVNALEVSDLPVRMQVGSSTENVTVSAEPPALESSNATLGATLEQQTYSALPLQMGAYGQDGARRATDFVALMPGVQFNETNGNATTNSGVVNGGGARGAVSDIYINGMPFISAAGQGDPRFVWSAISVDAINQLQVQTIGYSAIYEGQGVQNYSIKQGTNRFHGSVYEYFRNTALDTYGFFDKATSLIDPISHKLVKPAEHQNEFGGVFSGPIVHDKLFFFANFNKYTNSRGPRHVYQTNPTTAEMNGDFSALGVPVYDPTACPNGNTSNCQRPQFSSGGKANVIPASKFSSQALFMQKFLPPLANQNPTLNYIGGYNSGLDNWTATGKLDYTLTSKQSVSFLAGIGSQSTTGPARQTATSSNVTTTFNQAPAPYIDVQQFNPKTKVYIFEHTYVLSPRMVNQFKYGFGRYEGSGFNQSYKDAYSATTAGISGLPSGQAAGAFPNVRFTGTAAPNYWAGYTGNHQATNAYTLVDNFSLVAGRHSLTFGVQMAWLQYNYDPQLGGSSPLQLNFTAAQTGCYAETVTATKVTSTTKCYTGAAGTTPGATVITTTGLPYASYILGAVSSASFTTTTVEETGARFRPISPYVQDDWKINPKLTVNIGLRWDYYPPFREVQNRLSFLDPNATNPITGTPGALSFAGSGSGPYCNCNTNVQSWYKNFGPRFGIAYSPNTTTVIRASAGVIYAHGNGTGGSAISRQGSGLLGFSASPSYSSSSASLPAFYLQNGVPTYTAPPFLSASYGTGYYTGGPSPQTIIYGDPRYGDRAPQFINWSFGIQQAFTNNLTLTASYVGSQGHFLQPDSQQARGKWINQLDPKYLVYGSALSNKATPANLAAIGLTLPYTNYDQNQTIAKALAPFPQYNGITDAYGATANSNYHALQTSLVQRYAQGMSFMVNYTWAKNIDDAGTFRSGYAIPAAFSQTGKDIPANRAERALSLADRRHNLVVSGVFDSPFGTKIMADKTYVRAILGGFKLSTIIMAYTGSPLAITATACGTNPAQGTCLPSYNPAYTGKTRINGHWGNGVTADNVNISFLDSNAFIQTPAYMFSNAARTAPNGITGPGSYNIDLSLRRMFALPHMEQTKLTLQGDLYNLTNHTQFGAINTTWGNASFGQVTNQANFSRDAQLSARIEF
jgi:hypothetical protein